MQFGFVKKSFNSFGTIHIADSEWMMLHHIQKVLKPFWDYTNAVSTSNPTIVESLLGSNVITIDQSYITIVYPSACSELESLTCAMSL
jgi:hypothetical protein